MSSRIFQSVIVQMKEATDRVIGVVDSSSTVVASGELAQIGTKLEDVVFNEGKDVTVAAGRTYKALGGFAESEYTVFVDGADALARTVCLLASVTLHEAKVYYEEKHDRAAFIKSIISDNILPGDIYARAKELSFSTDVARAVFLIRQVDKNDLAVTEVLQNLFPDREREFVVSVSETDLVLIKEMDPTTESEELLAIAERVEALISAEFAIKTVIGVGTMARHLRELADRYKEAQVAIEVGKVFDTEKTIIHYEHLGIGRLIYQLPITLCEMFLSEIFKKNPIDSLDEETLYTINRFFENSLNVSETSRKLFVHRNTLVYRLEKIKKLTGLDLREFDHAIVFKVALMVKKYLNVQAAKQ
ncbi:MAG: helix-turn-helix domain-containing protein [Oscillospiraceae bacterium]|nr:helix-turn-helix domain-containing protein [Oscillospiraceae bacterium]